MSGDGGPLPSSGAIGLTDYRLTPTRDELRAFADNLRDMLSDGKLEPRLVREAANAFEAMATGEWFLATARFSSADLLGGGVTLPLYLLDDDVQGAPIGPPLETYESGEPSRPNAAP